MFGVLIQYIRLYAPPAEADAGSGAAAGSGEGAAGGGGAVPARPADFVVPACDAAAMCAYLRLFR